MQVSGGQPHTQAVYRRYPLGGTQRRFGRFREEYNFLFVQVFEPCNVQPVA